MLCGKYRLDRSHAHPLLAELPPLVHLPNRAIADPELRAAVDLLGGELGGEPHERRPGSAVALPSLLDLLLVYDPAPGRPRAPTAPGRARSATR
ncbi:hypothetical protein SNARM312S_07939 [Streptomyces narbonensis]